VELIAAVDLLGERGVRLRQGDYADVVGGVDPLALVRRWASAGVPRLHLIDLDGARAGEPRQAAMLARVCRAARAASPGIRIQAGGGLRTLESVAAVLEAGADLAVLGTAAIERPGFVAECAARWPGRVLAALDLRRGQLAIDGWLRDGDGEPYAAANRLLDEGAAGLIVTDTRRDGALSGPNLTLLRRFRANLPGAWLAAAGGVRTTADLVDIRQAGIDAAIVGMALLTGTLRISDAVAALVSSTASA
jgi:phosphoribosylformimino-5-aminoimidazole carboxamide ribotide isomerase